MSSNRMNGTGREARTRNLAEARACASAAKTQQALAAVARLHATGQRVTFARVAQDAAVSTWFTYHQATVAAAIRTAQQDQAEHGLHHTPSPQERVSAASLRTDLEHTRDEVRSLRQENTQLRKSLATRLGIELTHPDPVELADRLRQVEQRNHELAANLNTATRQTRDLADQLTAAEDSLVAAREGLRRMIKQNRVRPPQSPYAEVESALEETKKSL